MLFRIKALLGVEIVMAGLVLSNPYIGTMILLLLLFTRPQDDRPNMQELHIPMVMTICILLSLVTRFSKDFAAAQKYIGSRYTQHNPAAPDGPEGFKKFIDFLRDKYPASHSDIRHAFADGDYVILHVHAVREPNTAGSAIVDIFKLEDGKIVEHWDVIQPIPEKAANGNGMF